MKKLIIYTCLLLSTIIKSQAFASTALKNLNIKNFKLKNGLEIYLIENHRAPVIYHSIWYKVGSADSPSDKTGLAHFVEHLMFEGSKNYPGGEFKQKVSRFGGWQNANTDWDRTAYHVLIAKEFLEPIMAMEADRMSNLIISDKSVEKERTVVLQERRQALEHPTSKLAEASNAAFFWMHPYGKPVIGFEDHIKSYTTKDVRDFYDKWYHPNNATLVIAGDITENELKNLAEKYYGVIKSKKIEIPKRLQEPSHLGTNIKVEISDSNSPGTQFQRIYKAPNFKTSSLKNEATLTLLSEVLSNQTHGILTKKLVQNQKLAHYIASSYTGYRKDPYSFTISAAPKNLQDLVLLEASIDAVINDLITNGSSDEQLKNIKNFLKLEDQYTLDSISSAAEIIGNNISYGYSLKSMLDWDNQINSVTTKDIQEAARIILGTKPLVSAYSYRISNEG